MARPGVVRARLCSEEGYDRVIPQLGVDFGQLWLLSGPLGVGKTTFVRRVLRWMGYSGRVKSPTFNYMFEYVLPSGSVLHVDLYRLERVDDTILFPVEEAIESGSLVFVEWPEKYTGRWKEFADEVFDVRMSFHGGRCRILNVQKIK